MGHPARRRALQLDDGEAERLRGGADAVGVGGGDGERVAAEGESLARGDASLEDKAVRAGARREHEVRDVERALAGSVRGVAPGPGDAALGDGATGEQSGEAEAQSDGFARDEGDGGADGRPALVWLAADARE